MPLTTKSKIFLLAALMLFGVTAARAEEVAPIPVKIGAHESYTRIVFDMPKLRAYRVKQDGANVVATFDTPADAAIGPIKSPHVKSMTSSKAEDGTLKVDIGVADGATIKHYRLQRRIVIDVYGSGVTPPPEEKKKPAPPIVKAPPAPEPVKAAETKPEGPAPVAAETPLPVVEKPKLVLKDTPSVLGDTEAIAAAKVPGASLPPKEEPPAVAEPAPPPPAAKAENPEEKKDLGEATITLSSLEPVKAAVFERFNSLWIVTDSESTSAAPPQIEGPMASFIMPLKELRFEGGTAWRYTLPRKFYVQVSKQSLSWSVTLLAEAPPKAALLPSAKINIEFDKATRRARMMAVLKGLGAALKFEDPEVGDTLYVVPTALTDQAVRSPRRLTDFELLSTSAGLAVRPMKDGVSVTPVNDLVLITSLSGLNVAEENSGPAMLVGAAEEAESDDGKRLFDFPNWRMGGLRRLQENKKKLQEQIVASTTPEERAGHLMKMAMLYFSNNFGQEALGVLDMVQKEMPEVDKNPDFIAVRGAANAMSGRYQEALQDLSFPAIQHHPEVNLWIGFAAAATEQWRKAERSFPKSNRLLLQYPDNIATPFTVYMAESALRLGHADTAQKLLDSINTASVALDPQYQAAIDYLRGEALSQQGKTDQAIAVWEPVANGLDRLYHTKASLALTRLLMQQKKITMKEAVDRVDSLRFAWRGDGLEVEILRTLGSLRVQNGQILAGLEDMKQAADLADSLLDDSLPIRDEIRRVFVDLFVHEQTGKIPPLEAVSVYNAFKNLLPAGPEGTAAAINFADYMIRIDLLDKAAELMEEQVKTGLLPADRMIAVGGKLAAVYLLDARPSQALEALRMTERAGMTDRAREERALLKARAQSQLNQTEAAIGTLSTLNSRNAQRLKADVYWRAAKWSAAAETIEALLPDPAKPFNDDEAAYVVNAAVAWKLAGNEEKLMRIKSLYEAGMEGKKQADTFGVVTRAEGASSLSDRESMLQMAGEVDMFKGFLNDYKGGAGGS